MIPLRILEDLCLQRIYELQIVPKKPLQLSYIRIEQLILRKSVEPDDKKTSPAERLLQLLQDKCISIAETALIDFREIESQKMRSTQEKALANELVNQHASSSATFLAYANHAAVLIDSFKSGQFPLMLMLDVVYRADLDATLILSSLPEPKSWRWMLQGLEGRNRRYIFFKEQDEAKCRQRLEKYIGSDYYKPYLMKMREMSQLDMK